MAVRIIGRSEEKIGKNIQEISPTQIYFGPNIDAKDKEKVMRAFKNLTEAGIYPQGLYQ